MSSTSSLEVVEEPSRTELPGLTQSHPTDHVEETMSIRSQTSGLSADVELPGDNPSPTSSCSAFPPPSSDADCRPDAEDVPYAPVSPQSTSRSSNMIQDDEPATAASSGPSTRHMSPNPLKRAYQRVLSSASDVITGYREHKPVAVPASSDAVDTIHSFTPTALSTIHECSSDLPDSSSDDSLPMNVSATLGRPLSSSKKDTAPRKMSRISKVISSTFTRGRGLPDSKSRSPSPSNSTVDGPSADASLSNLSAPSAHALQRQSSARQPARSSARTMPRSKSTHGSSKSYPSIPSTQPSSVQTPASSSHDISTSSAHTPFAPPVSQAAGSSASHMSEWHRTSFLALASKPKQKAVSSLHRALNPLPTDESGPRSKRGLTNWFSTKNTPEARSVQIVEESNSAQEGHTDIQSRFEVDMTEEDGLDKGGDTSATEVACGEEGAGGAFRCA